MTTGTTSSRPSVKTVILTTASALFGAALGFPLYFVSGFVLLPLMGFAAVIYGVWAALGVCVVLVAVAVVRLVRHTDRPCYWHAVLAGMTVFTTVMCAGVFSEYGFSTSHRSMTAPMTVVLQ